MAAGPRNQIVGGKCRSPLGLTLAGTVMRAVLIAAALTIAVGGVALAVRVGFASSARRWLAFPFAGIAPRPVEAARIFLHNLHALAAVGGLLLVAQAPYWTARTASPGAFQRLLRRLGEALLGAAIAANVIVIGAGLGAYGARLVRAVLPHGPLEVVAYALALALYTEGRQRPLSARHLLAVSALSGFALALAAVLETFVNV